VIYGKEVKMSKISIDINYIKDSLQDIGYKISDCIEKENNGKNWQIKFSNSGAIVTIYDTNNKKNSVINGKIDEKEQQRLKTIIDELKCKELSIDPINKLIVDLINNKDEKYFYDYKREYHKNNVDLLHDILCLSNNTDNRDSYLIFGVTDDCEVVGIEDKLKSNDILDFLKSKHFAGDHMPNVEVKNLLYLHYHIGIIICKSSKFVPFFLTERYKGINSYQIYTRVGDTNTPKNESANYSDIEKLWRIHFERENE
jgi:ATP-binding protein